MRARTAIAAGKPTAILHGKIAPKRNMLENPSEYDKSQKEVVKLRS